MPRQKMPRNTDFYERLRRQRGKRPADPDEVDSGGIEIPEDWETPKAKPIVLSVRPDRAEADSWVSGDPA